MWHQFTGSDECVECIVCGAHYCKEDEPDAGRCTGRTDLVHPVCGDASAHSLDGCAEFDETGRCEHLATEHDCDCSLCG